MKSISFKKGISALKSFLVCFCRKLFVKEEDVHLSCKKTKHFIRINSLHFKFISLSTFNSFFKTIDKFCKKHPFLSQVMIFIIAALGSYFVQQRFIDNTSGLENLISKGFFIAPLVTLMVSNQKAIVNHFSAVFFYDQKNKGIDNTIDKDNIVHKQDIEIRKTMIEVVYSVSPNKRISDYIAYAKKIIKESLAIRDGNDYRNATAMIFSGSALMLGFFMLLFGFYGSALTFLFYSLLLILVKEILGIRSIFKRSLFARFLYKLSIEKNKISPEERKKAIFGK